MATSEAQKRANQSYRQRNKEKLRSGSYKRSARLFIRKYATLEELEEMTQLVEDRRRELLKD